MIKIRKNDDAERAFLFSDNLRYMVRAKHTSSAKLAKKVGVSAGMMTKYILGRTFPSEERIREIADALECDVSELFDDTYAPWKFGTIDEE